MSRGGVSTQSRELDCVRLSLDEQSAADVRDPVCMGIHPLVRRGQAAAGTASCFPTRTAAPAAGRHSAIGGA